MGYNKHMNKIKEIRNKSGLSQKDFAKRHNVPLRTLQHWEQGRRNPPQYVIDSIIMKEQDAGLIKHYKIFPKDNFNITIKNPFLNCDKIYPIQQLRVANLLENFKLDANVNNVIIFGSSITNTCCIDSDLDVYLELKKDKKVHINKLDYELDLWNNYTVSEELLNEIIDKGVVVYER